jgi:hypothetical protein
MNREEIGYLCSECADELGWRWPEGHCATSHMGTCGVCKEHRSLTCWNDWLVGDEKEVANWD